MRVGTLQREAVRLIIAKIELRGGKDFDQRFLAQDVPRRLRRAVEELTYGRNVVRETRVGRCFAELGIKVRANLGTLSVR